MLISIGWICNFTFYYGLFLTVDLNFLLFQISRFPFLFIFSLSFLFYFDHFSLYNFNYIEFHEVKHIFAYRLDCCIGEANYRWYVATLFSAFAQLLLCSNLILTTVCHPFKVYGDLIMLPDDCSDVYFDVV